MAEYEYYPNRPACPAPPPGPIPVAEQLRVLETELGIRPNFPDLAAWLENEGDTAYVEANPYGPILSVLGGKRSVDGQWLPWSDQLLLVDTEEFESADRYEELLGDLCRISNGGLVLENITIQWEVKHRKYKDMINLNWEIFGKCDGHTIYKNDGWLYLWLISHLNTDLHTMKRPGDFWFSAPDQTILVFWGPREKVQTLNHLTPLPPFQWNAWGAIELPW